MDRFRVWRGGQVWVCILGRRMCLGYVRILCGPLYPLMLGTPNVLRLWDPLLQCCYYHCCQKEEFASRGIHNMWWVSLMAGTYQRTFSCLTVLRWPLTWPGTGALPPHGFRGTWIQYVMAWLDRLWVLNKFLLNALVITSGCISSGFNLPTFSLSILNKGFDLAYCLEYPIWWLAVSCPVVVEARWADGLDCSGFWCSLL